MTTSKQPALLGFVPAAAGLVKKKKTEAQKPRTEPQPWKQQPLFEADPRFFLMLSSLVSDGTAEAMGPYALACFVVLRCSASYETGICSLGQAQIAKQAGIKDRKTARKALAVLEQHGLIEKLRKAPRKREAYQLIDKVGLRVEGQAVGDYLMPYQPRNVGDNLNDLRSFLQNGNETTRAKQNGVSVVININITQNITNIEKAEQVFIGGNSSQQTEIEATYDEIMALPEGKIKQLALRAFEDAGLKK